MALNKSKLFIECDGCGKKIKYGAGAFHIDGYCGIYHCMRCATEYFGRSQVEETTVDYDLIENCNAKLYTTEFSKSKTDEPIQLKVEAVYEDRPRTWEESYWEYEGDWPNRKQVLKTRKVERVLPTRVGWKWHIVKDGKVIL